MEQQIQVIDSFRGDYDFLSNFYECPVMVYGLRYNSVEAAFQAQKFQDITIQSKFSKLSPKDAKREGRRLSGIRRDWDRVKLYYMLDCVFNKFVANKELFDKLLATGDAELIEGNTWGDTFWGVCNGVGENHLGKILMQVREDLRRRKSEGLVHLVK